MVSVPECVSMCVISRNHSQTIIPCSNLLFQYSELLSVFLLLGSKIDNSVTHLNQSTYEAIHTLLLQLLHLYYCNIQVRGELYKMLNSKSEQSSAV